MGAPRGAPSPFKWPYSRSAANGFRGPTPLWRSGGLSIRTILLAVATALALTASAAAEECIPSTSDPEVTTCPAGTNLDPFGCQYIDNDLCQFDCLFSIWWYFESNGIPGLQRGDEVHDDTCRGQIESDSIIS